MSYEKDTISKIVEQTDIVDIVGEYVSLKKAGTNYKGICPFHQEKTPSFVVSSEKQIFHCFGCHEGGDVITFLMKIENTSFQDSVKTLADRVGIRLEPSTKQNIQKQDIKEKVYSINKRAADFYIRHLNNSKSTNSALTYLKKRGITKAAQKKFMLGYAPIMRNSLYNVAVKNRIDLTILEQAGLLRKQEGYSNKFYDWFFNRVIFPIWDTKGRVIAFGGRVLDDSLPKYINSPETILFNKRSVLYGLDKSIPHIREQKNAIVLEGYMDLISLHQVGIKNTVATLGTALTPEHLKLLRRYTNEIVLVFDGDTAGTNASIKAVELFLNSGLKCKIAMLPLGMDPDDYVIKYGAKKMCDFFVNASESLEYFVEKVCAGRDVNDLTQKKEICEKVLPVAQNIESVLEENYLIKMLSEKIRETEKDLHYELERFYKKRVKKIDNEKQISASKQVNHSFNNQREVDLLGFLLNNPKILANIKKKLHFAWIETREIRDIIEYLVKNHENISGLTTGTIYSILINNFSNLAIENIISKS
ncbi:DNA primase, partial [bacterium]